MISAAETAGAARVAVKSARCVGNRARTHWLGRGQMYSVIDNVYLSKYMTMYIFRYVSRFEWVYSHPNGEYVS